MNPKAWGPRRWLVAVVVLLVPLVAAVVVYLTMFQGSNVAPLAITSPSATHAPVAGSTLAGTWKVASGSTAGYRVREQLGFKPAASDAVGRTTAMTGSATLTGTATQLTLTAATFKADVSQLVSDDPRRDNRIHSIGLESDTFPSADFALTEPVAVPAAALTGATVQVSVKGTLTLHGVSKPETFQLSVQQAGDSITVVGSLTFPWGDFGMTAPNVGGFVTVQSDPTLEFKLVLTRG